MTGPNKAILDIALNTERFDAFIAQFNKFKKASEELPETWRQTGEEIDETGKRVDRIDGFLVRLQAVTQAVEQGKDREKVGAEAAGVVWVSLYHFSGRFGANIHSATLSLAKWTGLTSVFSAILSAGGIAGIDRMAFDVAQKRATAAGYGNTYGEQQAFETSFARLGDPSGALTWMNNLLEDPAQFGHLEAITGSAQSAQALQGEDTGTAFADILPSLKAMVSRWPKGNFDELAQVFGIPTDLARILANMSPQEVAQMAASFRANRNPLNLPPEVLRKWTDLNATIAAAGGKLETSFANKIVKLTPGIGDFAKAVGDVITYVLRDGGPIDKWLRSAGDGLKSFDDSLNTRSLGDVFETFVKGADAVVSALAEIVAHPFDVFKRFENSDKGLFGQKPTTPGQAKANRLINKGVAAVAHAFGEVATTTVDPVAAGAAFGRAVAGPPAIPTKPFVVPRVPKSTSNWRWQWSTPPGGVVPFPIYGPKPPSASSTAAPPPSPPNSVFSKSDADLIAGQKARAAAIMSGKPASRPAQPASLGPHPNAQHWARERAKPKIAVTVPQGQTVSTTDYSPSYLRTLGASP